MNWKKIFGLDYQWFDPKERSRWNLSRLFSLILFISSITVLYKGLFNGIQPVARAILACKDCALSEVNSFAIILLFIAGIIFIIFLMFVWLSSMFSSAAFSIKLNDRIRRLEAATAVQKQGYPSLPKVFECPKCRKKFSKGSALGGHVTSTHKKRR